MAPTAPSATRDNHLSSVSTLTAPRGSVAESGQHLGRGCYQLAEQTVGGRTWNWPVPVLGAKRVPRELWGPGQSVPASESLQEGTGGTAAFELG